mgnify:FL=1
MNCNCDCQIKCCNVPNCKGENCKCKLKREEQENKSQELEIEFIEEEITYH